MARARRGRRRLSSSCVLGICLVAFALHAGEAVSTPGPPRLVQAQGLTDTTAQIAWTAEAGADSYRVYRDGTLITEQPGTLYDDGGLAPNSSHTYTVSVVSAGSESPASAGATAVTQAPADTSAPTQPGPITVSSITSTGAHLNWSHSSDNVKVEGYRILRGPPGAPPDQLKQLSTNDSANAYTADELRSGTSYQFGVMALDANNNHSPIRTVTFTTATSSDTTPPAAPSNGGLRTIPFSSSRIDVTWPASTSTDVASYLIYRNGVQVGEVENPFRKTFSDNGLAAATSYTYTFRAVDSAGNVSSLTGGRVGTTPAAGTLLIPRGPYIQWVTPDSARIAWWTNEPSASVVQYGAGGLTDSATDPVQRRQHMLLIGGLTPGTSYQYRVGDGVVMSATSSFSTAPPPGTTFSFAAVGDFGGGSAGETDVANSIAASGTQFTQTVGDNVYPDAQDPDFATVYSDFDGRFFKQYAPVIKGQAFWPANGNHEYYGDGAHWRIFWLPNNERWYSYDWGDAHILVLDGEQPYTPGSAQYQFAANDLSANQDAKWRIVIEHHPPYSSSSNASSSIPVRVDLVPLFEQQNVQLVLSGNSHNYERSYPLIGGVPTAGGVVYVVTGGGGNGHNLFTIPQPEWSAYRNDTDYQYTRVTVSPQSLHVEGVRGDTGATFDSTTIEAPPETGTIEVRKTLDPTSDPGRFDLQVDGQTEKSDATNGDSTGPVTVNAGTNHSVGELAGTATGLSDYSSQIACARNGAPAESGSGTSLAGITVTNGDAVVCTITNSAIARRADLSITKSDSPDPVAAGQTLTYTLTVTNNGPSDATDVTATDNLPSGVTYQSATPSQGSCGQASGTVTCDLGAIGNGSSATVEIKVTPPTVGTITNTASVAGSGSIDPNSANDSASAETAVRSVTDLSATNADSPDPATVGKTLTYAINVRNNGPLNATGVTLTDPLPATVNFVSATAKKGTCFQSTPGTIVCSIGSLGVGASVDIQIKVTPQLAGTITNTASVQGDQVDSNSSNNSASATTTVNPSADLAIAKSASPSTPHVGNTIVYTLAVQNNGPSPATGVTATDPLPTGYVAYQSVSSSQGSCSQSAGKVTCALGSLAVGGTASVTINVTAIRDGGTDNKATVKGNEGDPVGGNNSSTAHSDIAR